jgi:hypothetical protein
MLTMKKIFSCLLLLLLTVSLSGQQLYLEAGKVISSFDYKDSQGDKPEDLKGTIQGSIGLGYRFALMNSAWHLSFEISNNNYGATASDQTLGNYSEWDVSYLGLYASVDYEFYKPEIYNADRQGFSFYLKGIIATEFLLSGKQKMNSQVYDLKGVEEFDQPVYFLKAGTGLNYYITRNNVVFVQYIFGRSILFGDQSGQEELHYNTHTLSIGFAIRLFSNKR